MYWQQEAFGFRDIGYWHDKYSANSIYERAECTCCIFHGVKRYAGNSERRVCMHAGFYDYEITPDTRRNKLMRCGKRLNNSERYRNLLKEIKKPYAIQLSLKGSAASPIIFDMRKVKLLMNHSGPVSELLSPPQKPEPIRETKEQPLEQYVQRRLF